ncbi:RNA polymerase sigma factor [Singulisphaera sp. PoT]|uniref:RNA polymerase sigma factor n=1 Tax=Singulisphaera sp. PoT TaxID=3411797 RepID=UPI003BF4F671
MAEDVPDTTLLVFSFLNDAADAESRTLFFIRYGEAISGWCRKYGLQEADADDLAQDLLIAICTTMKATSFDRGKGPFRQWMKTVTRNACMDFYRRKPPKVFQELYEDIPARDDLERQFQELAMHDLRQLAMTQVRPGVSPRDWQVFTRRVLEGRPAEDVRDELGMSSIAAVHVATGRVRKRMQERMAELGDSYDGESGR